MHGRNNKDLFQNNVLITFLKSASVIKGIIFFGFDFKTEAKGTTNDEPLAALFNLDSTI